MACVKTEYATSCYCALKVGREQLVSLGQCIGKLTHSGKFRLTIGALDVLAAHAKYKVRQSRIAYLAWWIIVATQG